MWVGYRIFWVLVFIGLLWPVFGGLWIPLGCLGCLWTAIGAPFVTFGDPLGRLWGVIGLQLSPLGIHWGALGGHWGSLCDHILPKTQFEPFYKISLGIFLKEKTRHEASQVWENHDICGSKKRIQKKTDFPPKKRGIDFVCIFVGPNALPINLFTRLLRQQPNFNDTKRSRKNQS